MNQARVKLPGASDAGIKGELFDVLHEFFSDSSAWQEAITFDVMPTLQDYALVADGGQIVRLVGVMDANGIPVPASMPTIGTVLLQNAYDTAQVLTATVAKTVSLPIHRDYNNVPQMPIWTLPVWGRTILDGVLGKMMTQVSKSYTNETLGTYHLKRFRDGIAMAKTAMLRRNSFGAQAWQFPQGYRTRNQKGGVSSGGTGRF